ncbi:hypothetical protein AA21291_0726 [Swaminathania salitolerans LMG 21291]|uniref:Uncharacterized protein n=1 Tax=Swaminathania salitolerans TaxID=182838 RepID=A0A511BRZ3_9PROT|nr:hypothetical protein AA21291_0726 [Swaminathania salitolerans LMG 21291]GEL02384.1 hypothetical protein SSA02_15470 [Swaminathania salitolerans]
MPSYAVPAPYPAYSSYPPYPAAPPFSVPGGVPAYAAPAPYGSGSYGSGNVYACGGYPGCEAGDVSPPDPDPGGY